jgi:hypothetical protein
MTCWSGQQAAHNISVLHGDLSFHTYPTTRHTHQIYTTTSGYRPEYRQIAHAADGRVDFIQQVLVGNEMIYENAVKNLLRNVRKLQFADVNT